MTYYVTAETNSSNWPQSKIKKLSLREISVMDDMAAKEYARLAAVVRPIVYNQVFFVLALLRKLPPELLCRRCEVGTSYHT
jgi:hypothetical protein